MAIKVFNADLASALGEDRFLREIELTAGLSHPHILPLHDSSVAGGLAYYVMPFVEGKTLRDRLTEKGRLSLDEALRIVRAWPRRWRSFGSFEWFGWLPVSVRRAIAGTNRSVYHAGMGATG